MGGIVQLPPAIERLIEGIGAGLDHVRHVVPVEPFATFDVLGDLVDDPSGGLDSSVFYVIVLKSLSQGLLQGLGSLLQIEQACDAGIDLRLRARQPHGVKMAFNQISVGKIEGWSLDDAMHHADRAIDFYERVGDRLNSHIMRNNLSAHYLYAQQFADVVAVGEEALPFFRTTAQPYWVASTASNVAEAYYELGDWESAIRCAQEVLSQEEPKLFPYALHTLGLVALAREELDQASAYFQEVVASAHKSEDYFIEGYGWRNLGKIYKQQGEVDLANGAFGQSLQLFRRLGIAGEVALTEQEMQ